MQTPFILTLSLIVIAPIFIAAGNYLLIGRLIRAVLPPMHHKIFGISAVRLTKVFVSCDILSAMVQSAGSGISGSQNWAGPTAQTGIYVLMGGLSFQALTLAWYLCIFVRFHRLANLYATSDAPSGWRDLVTAVYVSSILVMVFESQKSLGWFLRMLLMGY